MINVVTKASSVPGIPVVPGYTVPAIPLAEWRVTTIGPYSSIDEAAGPNLPFLPQNGVSASQVSPGRCRLT